MNILPDGSVEGQKFTKTDCPYPHPLKGQETYSEYHERVNKLSEEKGFHKGDLTWDDYTLWCMGSGQYAGFYGENNIIK